MLTQTTGPELIRAVPCSGKYAFICFASFEERCLQTAESLSSVIFQNVFVLQFDEFSCHTEKNKKRLEDIFTKKDKKILTKKDIILLKNTIPTDSVDSLNSIFTTIIKEKINNIVVDVSCFNREVLLIFFHLLLLYKDKFESVLFIYNSAQDMNEKFLSFGVLEVRSVLGYGGIISPLKKDHLIILLGYETERASKIIEAYQPDFITIATGSPSHSINDTLYSKNYESLMEFKNIVLEEDTIGSKATEIEIPINDPIATLKALEQHIKDYPDHNIIIAPLNTKLSTLGAAMYSLKYKNAQICYPQMSIYNFVDYSKPSENFYVFDPLQLLNSLSN